MVDVGRRCWNGSEDGAGPVEGQHQSTAEAVEAVRTGYAPVNAEDEGPGG